MPVQVVRWSAIPAEAASLQALCFAVDCLANKDADETSSDKHNRIIAESICEHVGVPAALGKRHSALPYKVHAFLHSLHLECDLEDIPSFLQSIISFTTDLGTGAPPG